MYPSSATSKDRRLRAGERAHQLQLEAGAPGRGHRQPCWTAMPIPRGCVRGTTPHDLGHSGAGRRPFDLRRREFQFLMRGGPVPPADRFTCHTTSVLVHSLGSFALPPSSGRTPGHGRCGGFLLREVHNGVNCALLAMPDPIGAPMSDTESSNFGKFVPGFDFLQNLAKGASSNIPQMPNLGTGWHLRSMWRNSKAHRGAQGRSFLAGSRTPARWVRPSRRWKCRK